ncbi:Endoribonuclease L-PSP/chorismate mutase-like protein [Lipomyces oligophaga]|uniref:Endoribonuclease L-PSP/chorismate mutase-like protein n=1 Tax=Lipomyces oligophaga TaxID=45792 RepID=UPI0034CF1F11
MKTLFRMASGPTAVGPKSVILLVSSRLGLRRPAMENKQRYGKKFSSDNILYNACNCNSARYFSTLNNSLKMTDPAIKIISAAGSAAPRAPYSQATAVNGFIYCSGQIPMTPDGTILTEIKAAARQSLENLKTVLEAGNSNINKIFKVNIYLTDMAHFADVNEVYVQFFGEHRPARTCIAIKQLPLGAIIEIECIALE